MELVTFGKDRGCILKNQVKLDLVYIPDCQRLVIGVIVRRRDSETCLAKQMALATPFKKQLPINSSLRFGSDPAPTS